jgi:tetratricopeptide (TPR) repeat protein
MARLDRLAPVKEVAQICAAIGREFSYALLSTVADRDEDELKSALAQLEKAELVFRSGEPHNAVHNFKHALLQDMAYESILKSRRQVLHRRMAEGLHDRFPTICETQPEITAHHLTQAGLVDDAGEWWGRAGDRALRSSPYHEAIAHIQKALGLPDKLSDRSARKLVQLRLQIAYGNALISTRGYGAPEVSAAFVRARELAEGIDNPSERLSAHYGLWVGSLVRSELPQMRHLAAAFSVAQRRPTSPEAGIAHRISGMTCWFQGDFIAARTHLEQALAIYRPERDRDLAFRFGHDYAIAARIFLALVLWPLGEVNRAHHLAEESISHAVYRGHMPTLVYTHFHKSVLDAVRPEPARAVPHVDAVLSLSREHGLSLYSRAVIIFHGWTRWHLGDREVGAAKMQRGIALPLVGQIATALYLPLNEAEADSGNVESALAITTDQLAEIQRTGQQCFMAVMYRLRGELLCKSDSVDKSEAEKAFLQAIETARDQKTRPSNFGQLFHSPACTCQRGEQRPHETRSRPRSSRLPTTKISQR